MMLESTATKWYKEWYSGHHGRGFDDEKFAGYHERKPDHLLRLAMLMKLASNRSLTIQIPDLDQALKILNWLETFLPGVFRMVAESTTGELHQKLLKQLANASEQRMSHSALLRLNQHVVNARQFREAIETLKESACIQEVHTNLEHFYQLLKEALP
jgi:hypothetical protein